MSESEDPGGNLQPLKPGKPWQVSFAYAYFVGLLALVIGAFAVSYWLGIIDLQATFTFQADLGWVIEYLAGIILVTFALFTFVQIVRITGIGFIRGLMRTIARIADNYELPGEQAVREEPEGSDGDQQ
jgi:hypothetical protein